MQTLPIHEVIPEVKEKLQNHNRLVLQAPPGAGKTTALPLALLDEPWLKGKKILILEPRRLAVRSSAARMAELLGENEYDVEGNFEEPLKVVVEALKKYKSYEEMICHFPDITKKDNYAKY